MTLFDLAASFCPSIHPSARPFVQYIYTTVITIKKYNNNNSNHKTTPTLTKTNLKRTEANEGTENEEDQAS